MSVAIKLALWRFDAVRRLGPRPVGLMAAAWLARPFVVQRLARTEAPCGPYLPRRGQAGGVPLPVAPEGFDMTRPAARLDCLGGPDVRPVWEAARWGELPRLVLAGELAAADDWLAAWLRLNPPYLGPNWACGQEAALRALHLARAVALSGAPPTEGARALARLLNRRIGADRLYALAQDNNHPVSEAAGRLACALLAGGAAAAHAAALDRIVRRLVAPDGGFAQDSPAYLRLLIDVLAVTEQLRAAFGGPAAAPEIRARLRAAARLLRRLACPETGALPRLGHQDGSAFCDEAGCGPEDARGSLARAAVGLGDLGPAEEAAWQGANLLLRREGTARAVLRLPQTRFRPSHADALHLDLWDGRHGVLTDSGTGAYNPGPADRWWLDWFPSTAAHNTVEFDGRSQSPRVTRFLPALWPEGGALPGGGWMRDHAGCRHERHIHAEPGGRAWRVEDRISGPFRDAALRWHLPAEGPPPGIEITADAKLRIAMDGGWDSPAYGVVRPRPVLVARVSAPVSRLTTVIRLP